MARIRQAPSGNYYTRIVIGHDETGKPIVEPIFSVGRSTYFGDVSSHLAQLITRKLHYKARSEKPGLLGRASVYWQSRIDREEAEECGNHRKICYIRFFSLSLPRIIS